LTQREIARAITASFGVLHQQMLDSLQQSARHVLERISEQLSQLFAPLTQQLNEGERIKKAFHAGGMLAAPSMSVKLVDSVVRLHEVGNDAEIAKVVVDYYKASGWRRLKNMVESWELDETYIGERIDILKEALRCHCRGWFRASVPTLLNQVEGIASDFAFGAKVHDKLGHSKAVTMAALESAPMGFTTFAIAVAAFSGAYEFLGTLYFSINFADAYEELRHTPRLLGHAVRHGISIGSASEKNSMTLFLLLDSFSLLDRWMDHPLEEENNS
jgi:hypothetical protein